MNYPLSNFAYLSHGIDTVECAYYLGAASSGILLDWIDLAARRDSHKLSKSKKPQTLQIGTDEFFLASHGTKSGFPFVLENDAFTIQCGEFNRPNFFVTFRSVALWHVGAQGLHERFLAWANSLGLQPYQPEKLSRVDFAFDYHLPVVDFDEDSVVTDAKKDNKHRNNGKMETIRFGTDQIVLRIYDKVSEIKEASKKTWLFEIWGMDQDVWRIEWQTRKQVMKYLGIRTFEDLGERQGDLMRLLVNGHSSLRIKTNDSNRSRWPVHPLWLDLTAKVNQMEGLGVVRELDKQKLLEERLTHIAISIYGYAKRVGAIDRIYTGRDRVFLDETMEHITNRVLELHDPLTWDNDVDKRVKEMRLGEW